MSILSVPVYMDYSATTPCDERVVDTMLPYFTRFFGNTASRIHSYGWQAEAAVELAREQVAQIIHAGRAGCWTPCGSCGNGSTASCSRSRSGTWPPTATRAGSWPGRSTTTCCPGWRRSTRRCSPWSAARPERASRPWSTPSWART
jgi:Cysteine sulfinate desulfinase/cysteine desulfurase and related enzymes